MSNRASKRKKSNHINAACLLTSLLLAGVLAPTFDRQTTAHQTECDILASTDTVVVESSQADFPKIYGVQRDPWANPILSCSLVSPQDFGYDQRKIYRLPAEPRTGPVQKSSLRDPMSNLLLRDTAL